LAAAVVVAAVPPAGPVAAADLFYSAFFHTPAQISAGGIFFAGQS